MWIKRVKPTGRSTYITRWAFTPQILCLFIRPDFFGKRDLQTSQGMDGIVLLKEQHARSLSGTRDYWGWGPPNVARRGPTSSISPDGDLPVTCSREPRGASRVVALSTARCRAMCLSSFFAASRRHRSSIDRTASGEVLPNRLE